LEFLKRNQAELEKNPRMFHAIRQIKAMDAAQVANNAKQAQHYREALETL